MLRAERIHNTQLVETLSMGNLLKENVDSYLFCKM